MRLRKFACSLAYSIFEWSLGLHPSPDDSDRRVGTLRAFLRWCPTWTGGHLRFAALSLKRGEIPPAYGSAHVPFLLKGSATELREGKRLLGICAVRSRDFTSAKAHLSEVIPHLTGAIRANALEELAAAEMALGEFSEAATHLQQIQEGSLSPEGSAALQFAKSKAAARS